MPADRAVPCIIVVLSDTASHRDPGRHLPSEPVPFLFLPPVAPQLTYAAVVVSWYLALPPRGLEALLAILDQLVGLQVGFQTGVPDRALAVGHCRDDDLVDLA